MIKRLHRLQAAQSSDGRHSRSGRQWSTAGGGPRQQAIAIPSYATGETWTVPRFLAQTELELLQAQVNYQIARAAVDHATGGLLKAFQVQIPELTR